MARGCFASTAANCCRRRRLPRPVFCSLSSADTPFVSTSFVQLRALRESAPKCGVVDETPRNGGTHSGPEYCLFFPYCSRRTIVAEDMGRENSLDQDCRETCSRSSGTRYAAVWDPTKGRLKSVGAMWICIRQWQANWW